MRQTYPKEGQDRFMIRLPDGMRDQLKETANTNKRTISAEIVARLEESLRNDGKLYMHVPIEERIEELEADVMLLKEVLLMDRKKEAAAAGSFKFETELYRDDVRELLRKKAEKE